MKASTFFYENFTHVSIEEVVSENTQDEFESENEIEKETDLKILEKSTLFVLDTQINTSSFFYHQIFYQNLLFDFFSPPPEGIC